MNSLLFRTLAEEPDNEKVIIGNILPMLQGLRLKNTYSDLIEVD